MMKKSDIILLVAWIVIPPTFLFFIKGNFFISILLYFVLPAIFFSYRVPKMIPKALVAAFLTIPFVVVLDYLAFFNNAWAVPTIFSFHFFKFIPVEDFFFTFSGVYLITVAFFYFFRSPEFLRINITRLKRSGLIIFVMTGLFIPAYMMGPSLASIPYFDFWLVLSFFILPTIALLRYFPVYRKPVLFVIPYTFLLMLPYELTALTLGFWSFPGEYIGLVRIWNYAFPIEELLEWMVLFPLTTLAFTEFTSGFGKMN